MQATDPYFFLDPQQPEQLAAYLAERGWLRPGETVTAVGKAGEGNMNLTLRVRTPGRSFILKQARPWVEKYPSIPAPDERILVEAAFYEVAAEIPAVAAAMPALLDLDAANRIAQFEDLGDVEDLISRYTDGGADWPGLPALARWLAALHAARPPEVLHARFANRAMRALNHEHLFRFPLAADNGLDLDAITPGLQAEADRLKANAAYVQAVTALGERYLSDGDTLLHGDYYPGSWVAAADGLYVIDPEFCFIGPAEFDVAIFYAHLLLAGRPEALRDDLLAHYEPAPGFDRDLMRRFAGMELMRRLIGVAQLPLGMGLAEKADLLRRSEAMVLGPRAA